MQLFFSSRIEGTAAFLSAEETRHCKVLRKTIGDIVQVIDGKGSLYTCLIIGFPGQETQLELKESKIMPALRNYSFHLMIAPTKQNERMEWMLEKAIEAGLDEITFIQTEHSEKSRVNFGRLEKIALSAIKQSGQFFLPIIHPLTKLSDIKFKGQTLIAHCRDFGHKTKFSEAIQKEDSKSISVLIGPEGDFSSSEIEVLINKGAIPVSLGNSRLRTETAGVYCSMVLNAML